MNQIEKILNLKRTENGDKAYKSTGDNLTDLFFMTPYFEKHLDEVSIGDSSKEQLFSMYIRDPRFGLGRRDLGRRLMYLSKVRPEHIVLAGRYDDLWHIPTEENLDYFYGQMVDCDELAKKWAPRLTGKDKQIAKALCKMWGIDEKTYRFLIKTDSTVEYKLSYAEEIEEERKNTVLNELFNEPYRKRYSHPLVDKIEFEHVPSLAMTKYLNTFSTREDIQPRFDEYMQKVKEDKAKVNTTTANVYDAYKTATRGDWVPQSVEENKEILSKKIVDNATLNVELDCCVILDTSGSMYWGDDIIGKANSVAYALSTHSTYCNGQVVSFSFRPKLLTIHGKTMKEKYQSMYTGDCSNTDFGAVMDLLAGLQKYPDYFVVLSDMEFDSGSSMSKEKTMKLFKERGAQTKIIWWNFNERNKTVPEFDEYGNIFLSGYNMQILKLLENKFDMSTYIDKILADYQQKIFGNKA